MVRGEEQKQGPGVSSAEHSAKAPGLPFQETHDPTHP
jgi:hypothetical protein